jgi:hypothetical protein
MKIQDFEIGDSVDVEYWHGDLFNHDFTGHVTRINHEFVTVCDQEGNSWDCNPNQLELID